MKKNEIHAIKEALICLLNIHLPNQRGKVDKEMYDAQVKYIASTIRLLESLGENK